MIMIEIIGTHQLEDGTTNPKGGSVHHMFVAETLDEVLDGLELFLAGAGFGNHTLVKADDLPER